MAKNYKVNDKLLAAALQIAAENGSVTNKMLAPRFPDHTDQALSFARIDLAKAGLLEKITTDEYRMTAFGRDMISKEKPITREQVRELTRKRKGADRSKQRQLNLRSGELRTNRSPCFPSIRALAVYP